MDTQHQQHVCTHMQMPQSLYTSSHVIGIGGPTDILMYGDVHKDCDTCGARSGGILHRVAASYGRDQ